MSKLAIRKRNKKNLSRFQKMWQRVQRLKADIARRDQDLDSLVERVRSDILPKQLAAATGNVALLLRLLDLGQRKSWAAWQRQELEDWIHQNLSEASSANLLDDELRDEVARYDAFRLGVELDENDGRSPGEQLDELFEQQQRQEADAEEQSEEYIRAHFEANHEQIIEEMLDIQLGPRPEASRTPTGDMFEKQLDSEVEKLQQEYDQKREKLRVEITREVHKKFEEVFADEDPEDDFGDDFDFRYSEEEFNEPFESKNSTFKLDNATVQRMFRSTAAVLHPDRESDPEKLKLKHSLMQELLAARKSGDVMTLLSLYQEHVENSEALSKDDEKQLIGALEQQVSKLENELKHYEPTSPLHETAFDLYSPHKKTLEKNIGEYLDMIQAKKSGLHEMARSFSSMNKLKPYLEERNSMRKQAERELYFRGFYDD